MANTFDAQKHKDVPEHIKISDKEKEELFKKHNIEFPALPKILMKDPAIQTLEAKEGDVVKIIRPSQTAGQTVFYRGVISE